VKIDSRARHGIVLALGAMACFGALDTLSKLMGSAIPVMMAMASRFLFHVVVTGGVLLPRRGWSLFVTKHPYLQAARGLLLILSSSLAYLSLRFLPVGEFTAIVMLTPLVITIFSATALGERVTVLRWLLVVGGFAGALLVIRPGAEDFTWPMLLPLTVVIASAGYQLITSKLARVEDPLTVHFYTGCVALLIAAAMLPFAWQTPGTITLWVLLLGVGILGTLGHYLLILSYGRTSPATLSPYLYTQIAFATLAGWLVFSHAPDAYAVAGILVIAGCGIAGTQLRANAQRARGPAGGDR
jgi:drug/metabolite transporter (DMT)-like permease